MSATSRLTPKPGEDVPEEDRVKGCKAADGSYYVLLEDEELDEVALESTHTIEIEAFVPRKEVDEIYLDESYYLVPDDKVGVDAFAVIRDAISEKSLVGLARVVLYRRERLLMLEPRGKGIKATVAALPQRGPRREGLFRRHPERERCRRTCSSLPSTSSRPSAGISIRQKFEDRYEDALKTLIKAKQAGKEAPDVPEPKPSNVINLMDALRRSVKADGDTESPKRGKRARRRSQQGVTQAHGTARANASNARAESWRLDVYRKKRKFGVTPEPRGRKGRVRAIAT